MEGSIFTIKIPDTSSQKRTLEFYVWNKRGFRHALVLGFAPHDIPLSEEPKEVCEERMKLEALNRTMRLKSTIVKDEKGKYFDQKWEYQAVLIALWRKLENLGFLRLPKNPFLGKCPKHVGIIDYEKRFRYFHDIEIYNKRKKERA